jgi:hypothetical protein
MAGPSPSYYFTLFKKFQVLGHLPEGSDHGAPGGLFGYDVNDPASAFGSSSSGTLLGSQPSNSPLWAMLNAAATGASSVTIGATTWPAMPLFVTQSWQDFQLNAPAPKLVPVFSDWIQAGKTNDIPNGVIATKPGPIKNTPDAGASPFVCSFNADDGTRPGGVPSDFWDTSLIFLVDPSNGNIVTPATLTGGSEFFLTAVVGNRGQQAGGRYSSGGVAMDAKAIVMVWNTAFSPGVELPALSNLDVNSTNSIYDQYFLDSGQYDVVGFRMNIQSVYDGIVAELNSILAGNPNALGGLDAETWVKAQPAHLCAKVVVRNAGGSFPNVGDTPINNRQIAQKNLAPFAADLGVVSPDPNIVWKNFIVGQPFFLKLGQGEGRNLLTVKENLKHEGVQIYLAIPTVTFERYFREGGGGAFKGFEIVPYHKVCNGQLGELARPFPQAVILRYLGGENLLELPALGEEEFLGMSLGIEYSVKRLKPGLVGEVKLVHRCLIPRLTPGSRCFEIEDMVVGGFTIVFETRARKRSQPYPAG